MKSPQTPVSELIRKKREGQTLNSEELHQLVSGFSNGSIPDYQISAWLMASFLCGMSQEETFLLTQLMRNSGHTFDWRSLSDNLKNAHFADKHSTGGVGDKVSLILAPLATVLDLKVPMMSGRGLGHTGGTVDKLESIPGFTMQPTQKQMIQCLDEVGACMMSQSKDVCPADAKLYALRDVTATVESIPLITASIVSKKWAEGIDAIVFDVKCGSAAFMKHIDEARSLGESLMRTAKLAGLKALSCITRMEEPLGSMIGNALEVEESMWILSNTYPSELHRRIIEPLKNLCIDLTCEMALLAGTRHDIQKAREECEKALQDGRAYTLFERMARIQGAIEGWRSKLPKTQHVLTLEAPKSGLLAEIYSRTLGVLGLSIGVGRQRAADIIDPAVGFEILVSPGEQITQGQPLLRLHAHTKDALDPLRESLLSAFLIEEDQNKFHSLLGHRPHPLVMERISE
jgi:pyrimidine-nucleoside phosphorylase